MTGAHTLMLKVKTHNTETLEELIESIRSLAGVARTETTVVLSTHTERFRVNLQDSEEFDERSSRRPGASRSRRTAK